MNHRDDDGDDKATSADAEPSHRRAARHDVSRCSLRDFELMGFKSK
jgi:hypothetical protein